MPLSVETTDGRTGFEPGDETEVELQWELDEPAKAVELRVVWNTAGKGTTDVQVVKVERIEDPSLSERRRMKLTLPRSPYSYSGRLVSIVWALELVALPKEESARLEIVIGPGEREVSLVEAE